MSGQETLIYAPAPFVDKDGVMIPIKTFTANGVGIGNDYSLIPAVTGKCIRVLSFNAFSNFAGVNTLLLKSASAGAAVMGTLVFPAVYTQLVFPYTPGGVCETLSGQGLFCDTAQNYLYIGGRYIEFTPLS
jgi:hypothetical protein